MKPLHRTALSLCLSLLLSVTCLNLFSLNAAALTPFDMQGMHNSNPAILNVPDKDGIESTWNGSIYNFTGNINGVYDRFIIGFPFGFGLNFDFEMYDYYCYFSICNNTISGSNTWTFFPTSFGFDINAIDGSSTFVEFLDARFYDYSGVSGSNQSKGFYAIGKFPDNLTDYMIDSIRIFGSGRIFSNKNIIVSPYICRVLKGTSSGQVDSIIAAINQQTEDFNNKIDEVLTPEGENNLGEAVDQITDQVQENLGALGFAHDTIENFVGLFNEDPPAPVITVPPLKMKIQGVEHQFFNGYQYDFRSLEEGGLTVLVGAARTAGTLVLWWAFLQYCLKEFDGFFRR